MVAIVVLRFVQLMVALAASGVLQTPPSLPKYMVAPPAETVAETVAPGGAEPLSQPVDLPLLRTPKPDAFPPLPASDDSEGWTKTLRETVVVNGPGVVQPPPDLIPLALRLPVNTVRSRLFRSRMALKSSLEPAKRLDHE